MVAWEPEARPSTSEVDDRAKALGPSKCGSIILKPTSPVPEANERLYRSLSQLS